MADTEPRGLQQQLDAGTTPPGPGLVQHQAEGQHQVDPHLAHQADRMLAACLAAPLCASWQVGCGASPPPDWLQAMVASYRRGHGPVAFLPMMRTAHAGLVAALRSGADAGAGGPGTWSAFHAAELRRLADHLAQLLPPAPAGSAEPAA